MKFKALSPLFAVGLSILILTSSLMSNAQATITQDKSYEFLNPLGTYYSWSFERTGYWSSNYGGYRSSSRRLHQTYSWRATGSSSGNYLMWRYVETSCLNAIKGRYAMFSFFYLPTSYDSAGSKNNARAVITVVTSYGTSTYRGQWIKPIEYKWHSAHVNAYISSSASSIKVTIEGSKSFSAYIDVASLAIRDSASKTCYFDGVKIGKLGMDVNLYEWRILQGATYDGRTFISTALHADGVEGIYIRAIKLYIEMQPLSTYWRWWPPGWVTHTTQEGELNIEYLGQANDYGHQIDPAATEAFRQNVLEAAEIAIDFGVGLGFVLIPATGGTSAVIVALAGAGTATGAKYLLPAFASDANDRAAYGGEDYSAHEQWDYPTGHTPLEPCPFVRGANGHLQFSWIFDTDTATSFTIKITASVNLGAPDSSYNNRRLFNLGWYSITKTIIVYA